MALNAQQVDRENRFNNFLEQVFFQEDPKGQGITVYAQFQLLLSFSLYNILT